MPVVRRKPVESASTLSIPKCMCYICSLQHTTWSSLITERFETEPEQFLNNVSWNRLLGKTWSSQGNIIIVLFYTAHKYTPTVSCSSNRSMTLNRPNLSVLPLNFIGWQEMMKELAHTQVSFFTISFSLGYCKAGFRWYVHWKFLEKLPFQRTDHKLPMSDSFPATFLNKAIGSP